MIEYILFFGSIIIGFLIWSKIKVQVLGRWWSWTGDENLIGDQSPEEVYNWVMGYKSKSDKQLIYGGCFPITLGFVIFLILFFVFI